MIKLRHLRASCTDLFCCFKLRPDDNSKWVVVRLDNKTKYYKCYNLSDNCITMYVNHETLVYEAEFE